MSWLTNQLSTEKDIAFVKEAVAVFGVPVVDVFIPEYGGPFVPPDAGDKKFWFLKFANGKELNVGLVKYFIKAQPVTWYRQIADELFAKSPFSE